MPLSILSLNLWHDSGPWPERAKLIREWIEQLDPDLIGLQEVLVGPGLDLAAELLGGSGLQLDFGAASPFERSGTRLAFGNAVATRWPIVAREELRLPDAGDGETRAALRVRVAAPFGPVSFTCTHLNWRFEQGAVRERQARAVGDFVLGSTGPDEFPPILVGDLNAEPDSAEIRYLSGLQSLDGRSIYLRDTWRYAGGGGAGLTWSRRNPYTRPWLEPDRRIDYVFVGPPQRSGVGEVEHCRVVCDAGREGVWPSDHFGVYAELRTEPMFP
jgi:endonuclease/exonuclease/phosphatase family metal-dependent hydrolase